MQSFRPIGEGNPHPRSSFQWQIDELIAHTYKGDHEKMKLAVNNVATVLQNLQKEMVRASLTPPKRDNCQIVVNSEQFLQGSYAEMVRAVNAMLDAISAPLIMRRRNRILAQVSNGKIDELIAQTYKGDHEKMKQAINNVATNVLQGLQKEMARLTARSASSGELTERGRHEQFRGAYADIVRGVNGVLDAVIAPLNTLPPPTWIASARATFRPRSRTLIMATLT